jgi:transposase-like protein
VEMFVSMFQCINDAPDSALCENCESMSPRVWTASRAAIDIRSDGHALLKVVVGVFYCARCKRHFRNQPTILRPHNTFTNRTIEITVASVIEDGMPVTKVIRRMKRDFGVKIAEGTIRSWLSKAATEAKKLQPETSLPFVTQETSGVLCIDEAYSGRLAILIATDPNKSDQLVGYMIGEKSFDRAVIKKFLEELRSIGINPQQIVTDESALYPTAIREVWPLAAHQLCLFHVSKKLSKVAKKAIQNLKKTLPKIKSEQKRATIANPDKVRQVLIMRKRGFGIRTIAKTVRVSRNSVKKWLEDPKFVKNRYGIDSVPDPSATFEQPEVSQVPDGWMSWSKITEVSRALGGLAYSVSSRKNTEKLQKAYEIIKGTPVQSQFNEIRSFVTKWHDIWWLSSDKPVNDIDVARERWQLLKDAHLNDNTKMFSKFQQQMTPELFSSLTTYLENEGFQGTNNSAERYARRIKKIQKTRYRIRSAKHIEDHILLNELSRRL